MPSDALLRSLIILWAMPPMLYIGYAAYVDVVRGQSHGDWKHLAALFAYIYVSVSLLLVGMLAHSLYEVVA